MSVPSTSGWRYAWIPATAAAAILISVSWVMKNRQGETEPLSSVPTTSELRNLASDVPAAVVKPLVTEWSHVNGDISRAAEYLLASLP